MFTALDGLMGFTDTDTRMIYVSSHLNRRQRRATLVHEVLHALRGDTTDDPAAEAQVARDTAAALVPLVSLVNALTRSANVADLLDVLDVDHGTLRTRIRNLTDDEASQVRRALALRGGSSDGGDLCAIGRWWRHNRQPDPLPCTDCQPQPPAALHAVDTRAATA